MKDFALSSAHGSIDVSVQAFAFWSSSIMHLLQEPISPSVEAESPSPGYKFVVEVHDAKAPARVQITTHFSLPNLVWVRQDGAWHLSLYVLGLIYNRPGELVGQFGDTFGSYAVEGSGGSGLNKVHPDRYDTQVDLPPGDYELHMVVSDGKQNFGRAQVPLRVGRLQPSQLSISDIALSDFVRPATEILEDVTWISPAPLVPTPLISNDIQFFPAADTRFKKRNPLAVYFEVYEPLLEKEAPTVSVLLKVTDLKGGATKTIGPESAAKWITPRNPVIPIAMTIALNTLSKGSYRVQVRASDSAGRQSEWQQADFTVK